MTKKDVMVKVLYVLLISLTLWGMNLPQLHPLLVLFGCGVFGLYREFTKYPR